MTNKENKNILFVAYFYPPLAGSGVYRSIKFSKYLSQYSWNPIVLTTDRPPPTWNYMDESLIDEIPNDVTVYRISDPYDGIHRRELMGIIDDTGLQKLDQLLMTVFEDNNDALKLYREYKKSDIKNITQIVLFQVMWAVEVIRFIEENYIYKSLDAIYTTTGPDCAHLIGYYLKKKYNIPWMADFRDEWTNNPYFSYDIKSPAYKLYYYLEKNILNMADSIISVSECIVSNFVTTFKVPSTKVKSITNGYDELDFCNLEFKECKNNKFTITYCGVSNTKLLNPIFEAINYLIEHTSIDKEKVIINIVGSQREDNIKMIKNLNMDKLVILTEYCNHSNALKFMIDADILLLPIGDDIAFSGVYSGKIFEYLRSGVPILAIAPYGGVVDAIIQETGQGVSLLSKESEKIRNTILGYYEKWRDCNRKHYYINPSIMRFERKNLTSQLAAILEHIVK